MDSANWGGYSSGSDDANAIELEDTVEVTNYSSVDNNETKMYPIKLKDHGSTYANVLYDVEGRPLKGEYGTFLNVKTKEMKDAFDNKNIRLIHCMKDLSMSYRYFATSDHQVQKFQTHREFGSDRKLVYHVYLDEDVDRTNTSYLESVIPSSSGKRKNSAVRSH